MKEFGPYLTYEFVQGGLDDNEALGSGICYSLTLQLIQNSIRAPQKKDLEIKPVINGKARFKQLMYQFKKKVNPLEHYDFIEKMEFEILLSKNFQNDLMNNVKLYKNNFINSSGKWAAVGLYFANKNILNQMKDLNSHQDAAEWFKKPEVLKELKKDKKSGAHILTYRIDETNKRIALFDCNIGYFSFDNVENGEAKLIECLNQLIHLFYKNIFYLRVSNLIEIKRLRQILNILSHRS